MHSPLIRGGHADFGPSGGSSGCCAGHSQSLGRTADGVPQVLKATREELKGGADFMKIMCGGGVASPTDAIETVQFTAEEIRAITTTCTQMGNKHSGQLPALLSSTVARSLTMWDISDRACIYG